MKATTIIIAAVLALQANVLLAENDNLSSPVRYESFSVTFASLAPSTPVEATFEEVAMMNEFTDLAPITPKEADFSDVAPVETIDVTNLAPTLPTEADFNDAADVAIDINLLAPVTPVFADFE
jgi:hypothetical protein